MPKIKKEKTTRTRNNIKQPKRYVSSSSGGDNMTLTMKSDGYLKKMQNYFDNENEKNQSGSIEAVDVTSISDDQSLHGNTSMNDPLTASKDGISSASSNESHDEEEYDEESDDEEHEKCENVGINISKVNDDNSRGEDKENREEEVVLNNCVDHDDRNDNQRKRCNSIANDKYNMSQATKVCTFHQPNDKIFPSIKNKPSRDINVKDSESLVIESNINTETVTVPSQSRVRITSDVGIISISETKLRKIENKRSIKEENTSMAKMIVEYIDNKFEEFKKHLEGAR